MDLLEHAVCNKPLKAQVVTKLLRKLETTQFPIDKI